MRLLLIFLVLLAIALFALLATVQVRFTGRGALEAGELAAGEAVQN